MGLRLNYFYPLSLSGADGGKLGGPANMRNISLGLQGLYWLSQTWGLGVGAYIDMRSISYDAGANGTPGSANTPSSGNQEIYMDGTYFYGSLIFNFGK
jgi:hypothetical protein